MALRRTLLVPFLVTLLLLAAFLIFTQNRPRILTYTADPQTVDYRGVEAGTEAVMMSWRAEGLREGNFMRMEAWVGERWVLIGEGFAPEKSDRIVVSHPLAFAAPLYRLTIVSDDGTIAAEQRLTLSYTEIVTEPHIMQFIAPVRGLTPDALATGTVTIPVLWHIEDRGARQQPIVEQIDAPEGQVIGVPLDDLSHWQPRQGETQLKLSHVAGDTVYLRLRVVDIDTLQTVVQSVITLPIVPETQADAPPLPILDANVLRRAREIYAIGQANGHHANRFIRIGDSNIANDSALCNFDHDNYDLGAYTDLQPVINRFAGSFCAVSAAAGRSFNSASVLDAMWADDDLCQPGEIPLACDLRRERPAYALIYLGVQDLERITWEPALSPDYYQQNLTRIVDTLADAGVVPILSTFPTGHSFHDDGTADSINAIIAQVAQSRALPLIDLRASAALYPNRGVDADGFHMSTPPGGRTSFTGNEMLYARTLYELYVLEVLRQLEQSHGDQ